METKNPEPLKPTLGAVAKDIAKKATPFVVTGAVAGAGVVAAADLQKDVQKAVSSPPPPITEPSARNLSDADYGLKMQTPEPPVDSTRLQITGTAQQDEGVFQVLQRVTGQQPTELNRFMDSKIEVRRNGQLVWQGTYEEAGKQNPVLQPGDEVRHANYPRELDQTKTP